MGNSHISLRRLYNFYNRKYFDGELPKDIEIIWHPCDDNNGRSDNLKGKIPRIWIDPSIQAQPKFVRIVMLHECLHIKNPRMNHGKVFKQEIKRLFEAGAYDGLL